MSGNAIKMGQAFVAVGAKIDEFTRGVKTVEMKSASMASRLEADAGRITLAWTAAGAAIYGITKGFASAGDVLDKMSARTGIAAESLSALDYVASQNGTSMDVLEAAVRKMQEQIARGGDGLKKLGVDLTALKAMTPEEQFRSLAERIRQIKDPTEQASAAMLAFGKSGTQLLPMINAGTASWDALAAKGRELGIIMTNEQVAAAVELTDAYDSMSRSGAAIATNLGSAFAPTALEAAQSITEMTSSINRFIKENQPLISFLTKTAMKTGQVVATWYAVTKAVKLASGGYIAVMSVGSMLTNMVTTQTVATKANTLAQTANNTTTKAAAAGKAIETAATGVNTGVTATNTAATWGLVFAKRALLATNPAGIALLAAGAAALIATSYATATTETEKLTDRTDTLGKSVDTTAEKMKKMESAFQKTLGEIDKLQQKTTLTAREEDQLAKLVKNANTRWRNLGLTIDQTTGKIENYIEAVQKMKRQKYLEDFNRLVEKIQAARADGDDALVLMMQDNLRDLMKTSGINEKLDMRDREIAEDAAVKDADDVVKRIRISGSDELTKAKARVDAERDKEAAAIQKTIDRLKAFGGNLTDAGKRALKGAEDALKENERLRKKELADVDKEAEKKRLEAAQKAQDKLDADLEKAMNPVLADRKKREEATTRSTWEEFYKSRPEEAVELLQTSYNKAAASANAEYAKAQDKNLTHQERIAAAEKYQVESARAGQLGQTYLDFLGRTISSAQAWASRPMLENYQAGSAEAMRKAMELDRNDGGNEELAALRGLETEMGNAVKELRGIREEAFQGV